MPVITRYANRKLYSKETRTYVTLQQIRDMIQRGEEVAVIDHQTGEDITSATLSQIIFDQERNTGLLPRPMLQRLVQAGSEVVETLHEGLFAFMNPNQFIEREIKIRLAILNEQEALSAEEVDRLSELLLAPEFSIKESVQEESKLVSGLSQDAVQELLDRLNQIEAEIDEIRKENG